MKANVTPKKKKKKIQYPSAELVQQACFEDYCRLINTYDKRYDKVNITLTFCGVILLVILGSVDYTWIADISKTNSNLELFSLLLLLLSSALSIVFIVWAVIQLLLLMQSKTLSVFDSVDIRNEGIYFWNPDAAAVWLIDKYTIAIAGLRTAIEEKQRKYDSSVIKIIISLILYSLILIIEKGIQHD